MTKVDVIKALTELELKAEALAVKVTDKKIPLADRKQIQEDASALKEHVKAEYMRLSKARLSDTSNYLMTHYWPAIEDAWANYKLSALRTNGHPKSSWGRYFRDVAFAARYWRPDK